jgi:mannan endo-1,4-beta-mannosidase
VFGEVANKQDESVHGETDYCFYDLDGTNERNPPQAFPDGTQFNYKDLLKELALSSIGWLAWAWFKDNCVARRMTSDGTYATLTAYGNDLVHHPLYGIGNDNLYLKTRRSSTL